MDDVFCICCISITHDIFERFYRIDNDLTRTTGGSGIGLSLARCFARDMGGDVTVAERPGGGSIFTLELPEETHG